MADQLLSIDSSNLESVADEIRTKAGLSSSQKLVFPDTNEQGKLGMITALQGITTEATVTPKINPQQVTLTKDSTSFQIAAGFHDGNGTVGITLQSKTVTPGSSQQDVTPDSGYLLSQVTVNAVSGGYKIAQGTATVSGQTSLSISGFGFTPNGFVVLNTNLPSSTPSSGAGRTVNILFVSNQPDQTSYSWKPYYLEYYEMSGTMYQDQTGMVSSSYNNITLGIKDSNARYTGTYFYFVWGS